MCRRAESSHKLQGGPYMLFLFHIGKDHAQNFSCCCMNLLVFVGHQGSKTAIESAMERSHSYASYSTVHMNYDGNCVCGRKVPYQSYYTNMGWIILSCASVVVVFCPQHARKNSYCFLILVNEGHKTRTNQHLLTSAHQRSQQWQG